MVTPDDVVVPEMEVEEVVEVVVLKEVNMMLCGSRKRNFRLL